MIHQLIHQLQQPPILQAIHRRFAGKDFLYIGSVVHTTKETLDQILLQEGDRVCQNTVYTFTYSFVRRAQSHMVYQVSFLAPLEKSFCCGNQCIDCILYRK